MSLRPARRARLENVILNLVDLKMAEYSHNLKRAHAAAALAGQQYQAQPEWRASDSDCSRRLGAARLNHWHPDGPGPALQGQVQVWLGHGDVPFSG